MKVKLNIRHQMFLKIRMALTSIFIDSNQLAFKYLSLDNLLDSNMMSQYQNNKKRFLQGTCFPSFTLKSIFLY